jgi:hypothetical protein
MGRHQPVAEEQRSRRKTLLDIESLARGHTRKAIRTLVGIMNDKTSSPQARIAAAKALLDRGWGAPPVAAPVSAEPQPVLKVVREFVHVNRAPEEIAKDQEPPLIEWKDVKDPTNGSGNALMLAKK